MKYLNSLLESVEVEIELYRYMSDNSIAIELISNGEPYTRLTTCLNLIGKDKVNEVVFLDTNNSPFATNFMEDYGFGTDTGVLKNSGMCMYPLYKIDLKKLMGVATNKEDFIQQSKEIGIEVEE